MINNPDLSFVLPGEDRSFGGNILYVDLVPRSTWKINARSVLAPEVWRDMSRAVRGRAGSCCEVCGNDGRLEAHERWSYDDVANIQKLERLICLCKDCHTTTHFGLAQIQGMGEQAQQHLMRVRGFTPRQAKEHIGDAFAVWHVRNAYKWQVDLDILSDFLPPTSGIS